MEQRPHPGDIDHHIMRDLGFSVGLVGEEMHGSARVVPEMWVPGSEAVRMGILAAWVDMVAGHLAIDLFTPSVPVTLDLDVHLHHQAVGVGVVRMVGRTQKAGRSVAVLSVDIEADGSAIGFAHATFMAAPNPSLKMPTVVSDEGLLEPHPARLTVPFAERAGCEPRRPGVVEIPMRPDGLNAAGTLNGGLLALAVEEAALSGGDGRPLESMTMRFVSPVRTGPAVAVAEVRDGLGNVVVRDEGRDDRLAVIATTRAR
ncbi:MAG: hotdog domain-containing protein [Acidimicrobiales bacterium]